MEANELTFAALFQSHPVPMWMFDAATLAFVEVNDAAGGEVRLLPRGVLGDDHRTDPPQGRANQAG